MKTAVSIPDDLFAEADRAAQRLGWSRSQVYAQALREFLAHAEEDDPVTKALDALVEDHGRAEPSTAVARALISAGDWEW